ncbi:hypothetical protein [uncultured Ruminococcus sp.]|uniref:hypothetical protein n=1 Tax=uncultured Ruminococcus sp. TaxID=165186 RepID=UPI0025E89266|nr:hypothetical protein [uncultured Ruminococcus sp.]
MQTKQPEQPVLPDSIKDRIWDNSNDTIEAVYIINDIEAVINTGKKEKANQEIALMMPEIKKKARAEAVKELRAEYTLSDGRRIYGLSKFNCESIIANGLEHFPNSFIPDRPINDPISEDTRLYFDDQHDKWYVREKNGLPKLISRFVVVGCLIVNASGPGKCQAFVVFLKGRADPLIFWGGIIEAADLRRQTQFHQKGLSYTRKDLYHESFLRALSMCQAVYFLKLPTHAGWNETPDGKLTFVSSQLDVPALCRLFEGQSKQKLRNTFQDIVFEATVRTLDSVVADYKSLLPNTLPIKIGTVISAMSRLLPHYKEEGLTQDRLLVIETGDDDTAKTIIAVMQNKNHRSTEALFSSMRMPYIEEEITHYVDCVAIVRHSCSICSMHDRNKIVKYLYEFLQNGYADDVLRRLVPVLFIDNAGTIPEEFEIHQLSIVDRLKCDNIEQILRVIGELDYYVVKFAENNPDAVKQSIKVAVTKAKEMVSTLPRRSQSSSAVMLLSTAIMLKDGGVLTDADVQRVQEWLRTEAKSRTSMSRSVVKAAGAALSKAICSGMLQIANQFGPPFWRADRAFIASDDSLNITKDTLEDEILPELPVGKNKALEYLEKEDILNPDGGDQKTWTVETEDGKRKPRRFYSLSRDLLTPEADRIVDEATASDLFHKMDKPINNFFPLIKHRRLDMVAGQLITDYKHGNTFIDVTGSVGSGKTDWIMMQVCQRAKTGDVVVVLDPTNAFCREELSGHRIPGEIIDNYFTFWDMSTQGWPVNILDFEGCEDITQRVQRLSSLLISGLHLTGSNQIPIVMTKAEEWLEEYEINNSFSIHNLPAKFDENAEERKLQTKLKALLSTVKDVENEIQPPGWNNLLTERGKVLVISAGNATINVGANPFDIIFDTLYSFKDKNRDGKMTVVLDEVQTLNHRKDSTLVQILSRVRKLDISFILASQDYLNKSLQKVYDYCGTHILFRPLGEECIKAVAELTKLDVNVIRTLPNFCCAIMGSLYSEYSKNNIQLENAVIGETYRPPYVGNYEKNV